VLVGTAAADVIRSPAGNDVMTGLLGADIFVFTRGSGADRIADFTPGTDRLLFEGIAPSTVKVMPTTVAGTAGLLVTFGPGDDSVFLANVAKLAAGDLVFG
jgi:Ca2+-binding RTX toxin-like protein